MQNQTKPKPLGAPMAKLVLVVSFIVGIGAVLGVAGYAVKNKSVKIQQPQVSPATKPSMPVDNNAVTPTISQSVKEKLDLLIVGKLNSEEKINIIIYSYDASNQDMVQTLQNEGAENVKLIESEPIKKEGIESITKDGEPLFITATIKAKKAAGIAELSWVRKITLNVEMTSQ